MWELFDAVVTGDRVGPSKPAPDIYLAAAAALGLAPEECLAVEDSYAGVKSAAAARCQTVMVPDLLPPTDETFGCFTGENRINCAKRGENQGLFPNVSG